MVSEAPGSVAGGGAVVGLVDAHAHLTAAVAFGGELRCGEPFAAGGAAEALRGCDEHAGAQPGALLEAILGGTDPMSADQQGWPDFTQWPRNNTQLHEQAYYRGVERAWRGGLRVVNVLLVANRVICELYPERGSSCDEMDQIRVQARYLRDMQDYIDAEHGGAGRGWFRIVRTPAEARAVAGQGKLAVVVGVESSELFGCRHIRDVAQCTTADIDAGLDEMQALGVSNLYPVHKFDNAFGGTRFDEGATGAAVNIGNLLTTGTWWAAQRCDGAADNEQALASDLIAELLPGGTAGETVLPVYPSGPICNVRGLTDLGRYLIQGMIARGMIINIDHMGVRTAREVLDILESVGYAGVMSSHTWSDREIIDRTIALSRFVASYAHAAHDPDPKLSFLAEWRANRAAGHGGQITGYGFGSDVNGLGPQAPPRPDAAQTPLRYPFTAPNGAVLDRHRFGTRTFDINTDGVAQYGLYADWFADIIQAAGDDGPTLARDLMNGAESYVAMWESARA
ncbi:hypothetical protein JK358_25485 [Nocardia sp. 2]|uniref:Membrane dipeptidase (Peptidase family M19) n=1 Tax=Nocardia acididurans TaxID=2802282 RepID=A0ABS1MB30_9NOCA|nr:hypothetical protein [Nocardia acididurans]